MPALNFSDESEKVLALSQEESARCNHEYIGTEHLLLGILRHDTGKAYRALQNLSVKLPVVEQTILNSVRMGSNRLAADYQRPFTTRSKHVFELSANEAAMQGDESIGPEHLLMGLLLEQRGIAAQVLTHAGVTEDAARAEVYRITS